MTVFTSFSFVVALLLPLASNALTRPPTFTVDYAKSPSSRWDGALELATQGKSWEDTWGTIFSYHNKSLFDYVPSSMYTEMGDALEKYFPVYAEELRGISAQFSQLFPDQVVSYEYLAAWVYFHALAHTELADAASSPTLADTLSRSCSALLAADSSGNVLHVANMDQRPPEIRDITLHVEFVYGSEYLFQGVDWYWFTTGTSRMVQPGVVSFQENWRRTDKTLAASDVLADIVAGVVPQILVFRDALYSVVEDTKIDFEDLVEKMSSIRLASPYYVAMAGPKKMQGVVIARNLTGVASPNGNVLRLGESDRNPTSPPELASWAIVQTNYDHWEADSTKDPRRTVGEKTLTNYGQDEAASKLGLFAVASTYPVHNPTTAYTAVMDPRTGELHPYVRVSQDTYCEEKASEQLPAETNTPTWAYEVMGVLALLTILATSMFLSLKSKVKLSGTRYEEVPDAQRNDAHQNGIP